MISSLELARLAGVSQGTVDRALHDRPGIADATRARILGLARSHGYQANPVAREMMGLAPSPLVGAVVHEVGSLAVFFATLMRAVHRRLRQDGLHLVMSYGTDALEQGEVAGQLLARRMRALLLVHASLEAGPVAPGTPIAALVLPVAGTVALLPDEVETGRDAARRLIAGGHRRLVMLSAGEHQVAIARRDGFVSACQAAGAAVSVVAEVAAALDLVADGASAVFCHHDDLAMRLLEAARQRGLSCPRDLSVVGVDGATDDLRIATMAYPFTAIAEAVAALAGGRGIPPIPPCAWRDGASAGPGPDSR